MKKNIKFLFITLALVALGLAFSTGCVSNHVYKESKAQIATRRAILSNNEAALHAIKLGEDPRAFGIEVSSFEVIRERPVLQAGAAFADGIIIWGGIEGTKWLIDEFRSDSDSNSKNTRNEGGRDATVIEVDGNNNTVIVRGDQSTIGSELPNNNVPNNNVPNI